MHFGQSYFLYRHLSLNAPARDLCFYFCSLEFVPPPINCAFGCNLIRTLGCVVSIKVLIAAVEDVMTGPVVMRRRHRSVLKDYKYKYITEFIKAVMLDQVITHCGNYRHTQLVAARWQISKKSTR